MLRRSARLVEKQEMADAASILNQIRDEGLAQEEPPANIDQNRYMVSAIIMNALLKTYKESETVDDQLDTLEILMNFLLGAEGLYFTTMCPQRVRDSLKQKVEAFSESDVVGARLGFKLGRVWQLYFA